MVCGDCWKFICCYMHVNFNVTSHNVLVVG